MHLPGAWPRLTAPSTSPDFSPAPVAITVSHIQSLGKLRPNYATQDASALSYAYTSSSHALSCASRAAGSTPLPNMCALIPTTLP